MKKSLLRFLIGYGRLSFLTKDKLKILNLLRENGVEFDGYYEAEEKSYLRYGRASKKTVKELSRVAPFSVLPSDGLLYRLKGAIRPGVAVGLVMCLFLLAFSSLFVWEVRIEGNRKIDDDRIVAALAESGFRVGSFLPTARIDEIENRFLIDREEIAWVNINLHGCVAVVDIIERDTAAFLEEENAPANLVASCDALITEVILEEGRSCVKVGEVVKKGELLASGVLTGAHETQLVRAKGSVIGRTKRVFSVEIPIETVRKRVKSEERASFSINFFGYSLNIFKDTNKFSSNYDIMYKETQLSLFGMIHLPIFLVEAVCVSYEEETVTLTSEEAIRAALRRLNADMTAALHEAELLSKKTSGEFRDGRYILTCDVVYLGNVAETVPFAVDK